MLTHGPNKLCGIPETGEFISRSSVTLIAHQLHNFNLTNYEISDSNWLH